MTDSLCPVSHRAPVSPTFEGEKRWRKDWKGLSFFSHGKTNSCGVLTLIGDSIDFKLLDKVIDDKGRYILLHCNIQNTQILLINSYFPNLESQQVEFIRSISDSISCMNIGNSTQIIWGGDFNFCFSCIDTDGGNYKPKQKVINLMENTLTNLELSDIWRIRNPDSRQYTWKTINPIVQRRLDFFLIANDLQPLVINSDIVSAIDTDHNVIILDINLKTNIKHGPAYWKFNLSLLQDIEYTEIMKLNIEQWKKDIKCTDTRVLWEYLKYKVRNFTISYSKGKAGSRHENTKQLEEKVNELEKNSNLSSIFFHLRRYSVLPARNKHLIFLHENITSYTILSSFYIFSTPVHLRRQLYIYLCVLKTNFLHSLDQDSQIIK